MDKEQLKLSVTHLIQSNNYMALKRAIDEAVSKWDQWPTRFAGHLEILNPLVDLGVASPDALGNVYALVERKRRTLPSAKKVDYQRDYMRQRRTRLHNAALLEEIVRGKVMTTQERVAHGAATLAQWMVQRDAKLAAHPGADWKRRNELTAEFWAGIDRQLEHDLHEANKVLAAPQHRKVRRIDLRQPKGELGRKLKEALGKRK